ncbi:MAG: hypothetical protein ACE5ER_05435 [Nitrospinaceae bacterium]
MTSHIPLTTKPNRNNGGFRKNESRNGNQNPRQRQGSYQEKPRGPKNLKGRFNGQPQANGSKPAPTPKAASSLPAPVDASIPRPAGLSKLVSNIEPFELFCAYHLGITPDKGYKPSNINEVANRFRADPATIRQALKDYGMDSASLLDRDFDMALSQLDIQVAPEGVDRKELAKNLYEEFLEAPLHQRDWKKILEEDRKENQKVFRD